MTFATGGRVSQQPTTGTGHLRSGQRNLGSTHYEIHVGLPNKPETVVELESPPIAQDGEILQLTLEDGRVLLCQVRGMSPYCRVLGEKPASDTVGGPTTTAADDGESGGARRRSDERTAATIVHPCPRCLATETLITHRGVTMTTLFCPVCRHGWGEAPAVVAAAARVDRRAAVRFDSPDRRSLDRVPTPSCTYCATDAHVRSVRHTASEVYFVCSGCDAMWVLPRARRAG
jgi:hypothetical protein